jgi:uncharacterized membrane protein YphA (DoxX/SURF4 family)
MATQLKDRRRTALRARERARAAHRPYLTIRRERVADVPVAPDSSTVRQSAALRQRPSIALAGLQLILGYEWLASGVDKLLYGAFPRTLGSLVGGVLRGGAVPAPFADLLRHVVIPHGVLFGVLIEWGETLAGLGLLAAGVAALAVPIIERRANHRVARLVAGGRRLLDPLAVIAAAGAGLMGLSFYALDGAPSPWFMPSVAFGGALDTGLMLALGSLVLVAAAAEEWLRRRSSATYTRYPTAGPKASSER